MGDAIITALVFGITMWVFLFIVFIVLGIVMTLTKNVGKSQKKFYNIELFRYDRPTLLEYDSLGKMLVSGLKMCSIITGIGFVIVLIVCIIAALT